MMINFDILNRWTGEVQFTAQIDCGDDASESVKIGLAVKFAIKYNANLRNANLRNANLRDADLRNADLRNANLRDADLRDANLRDADLRNADLRNANLRDADLWGCVAMNECMASMQVERYAITYTHDRIQIGCQNHSIDEWREFDDAKILEMDGRDALKWWRKYKDWLFMTIELAPKKPTKGETQ